MIEDDIPAFDEALANMVELLSAGKTELPARVSGLWFRVLKPYPLAAVLAAMEAHMRHPDTGRTLPIPADIVKHINGAIANDGRPGADEAWAMAAKAADDGATVVWTAEISEAWGIASSVLALGDKVGARVAFREAYNSLVLDARCARRPVQWSAALGTDRARRADAIRLAVSAGRLPETHLNELEALPAPASDAFLLIAGAGERIERDADGRRGPNAADRERMAATRASLAALRGGPGCAELNRKHTADLKAEAAAKVRDFRSDDGQSS